jgi:glycosyltransferase involved in cell wall biosynthesis
LKVAIITTYADKVLESRNELVSLIKAQGHSLVILGTESEELCKDKLLESNIEYYKIPFSRSGLNPIKEVNGIFKLSKLLKSLKIDVLLVYGVRLSASCSISAFSANIKRTYSIINGAGTLFYMKGLKGMIARAVSFPLLAIGLRLCCNVFFQNEDNRNMFTKRHLINMNQTLIINGSGVNLEKYSVSPLSDKNNFLFVGRIIRDKGVLEYINAARIVKAAYPNSKFYLIGPYDHNPTALNEEDIKPYTEIGLIEHIPWTNNIYSYLNSSFVFVHPSYHEGIPRTTLEAMAVGRPIITTDAPGCRDTVIDGINGFIVPVRNVNALSEKMIWMIENRDKVIKMGNESRRICQTKFDVDKVNRLILSTMNLL